MPTASTSRDISGLRWSVWRKQLTNGTVQPRTELFEQVQADILLAHLQPMEGGFGNPQPPHEVPVWGVASAASYVACSSLP
jgi:hypothetical protein